MHIREYREEDLAELVALTLRAFEPIFDSFRRVLGLALYDRIYPDWRTIQKEEVERICGDKGKHQVIVAEREGHPVDLLSYVCDDSAKSAEVTFLAVNPDYQDLGIGTQLNTKALWQMKKDGMEIVQVGTGGDEGHAPARRSYEKAGYTPLPLVRYYKQL